MAKRKNKPGVILLFFVIGLCVVLNLYWNVSKPTTKNNTKFEVQSESPLPSMESSATPIPYASSVDATNLAAAKVYDPLDQSGRFRTYTAEDNLFSFKYPANWSRIVVSIIGVSKEEEFFEDGLVPELRDSDGIGNDAFYIYLSENSGSLESIKTGLGEEYVTDVIIGKRAALKSGSSYYVKPTPKTMLYILAGYPDRINYEEIFNSFTFNK